MSDLNKQKLSSNKDKGSVKARTKGQFRCLYCFTRVSPSKGAKVFTCEKCGYSWRIWWFGPEDPRIRGPVWDDYEKRTQKIMDKEGGK
jgi:ribosomal protein L37AE/L43A